MRLGNVSVLEKFARKHSDAKAWLEMWRLAVLAADWRNIADVRLAFPSADGVKIKSGTVVTVFNVKGNEYRLLTSIAYSVRTVYVLDCMTHAEYDKEKWNDVL